LLSLSVRERTYDTEWRSLVPVQLVGVYNFRGRANYDLRRKAGLHADGLIDKFVSPELAKSFTIATRARDLVGRFPLQPERTSWRSGWSVFLRV